MNAAGLCFTSIHLDDTPANGVTLFQFDDDGIVDIVFTGPQGTFVQLGHGDGTFAMPFDLDIPGEGTAIGPLEGHAKLFVTTTQPDAVVVIGPEGDAPASYPAGANPVAFTRALLDGEDVDPILGLVTANAGDGTIGRYTVTAEGTLLVQPPVLVGGEPSSLSWTLYAGDQDPPWELAVLDRASGSLLLVHLLAPEPGVVATWPLGGEPSLVWADLFADYGTSRVLVADRNPSELRMTDVEGGLVVGQVAAWAGGPVAWSSFYVPEVELHHGLAVVLRDAGEVGITEFCNGEACWLEPPASRFAVGPDPSSFTNGDLDGDGHRDLVIGSPTHGITVLLADP